MFTKSSINSTRLEQEGIYDTTDHKFFLDMANTQLARTKEIWRNVSQIADDYGNLNDIRNWSANTVMTHYDDVQISLEQNLQYIQLINMFNTYLTTAVETDSESTETILNINTVGSTLTSLYNQNAAIQVTFTVLYNSRTYSLYRMLPPSY